MRIVGVAGWIVFVGLVVAAPAPHPSAPASPRPANGLAERFTGVLLNLVEQIHKGYVRPVERGDLLFAGLAALYEDARLPVPPRLRQQCKHIADTAGSRPGEVDEGVPTEPAVDDMRRLIRRAVADVLAASPRLQRPPVPTKMTPNSDSPDPHAERVRRMIVVSARAMTRLLDPFSAVVSAEEFHRQVGDDADRERFGLELSDKVSTGPVFIADVHPGGPGQRAGLRPGDRITQLDGKLLEGTHDAQVKIKLIERLSSAPIGLSQEGPDKAPRALALTYERPGKKSPVTVLIAVESFHTEAVFGVSRREDNTWNFFADPRRGLAYVRVGSLARGTTAELGGVIAKLKEQGLRGLVLDLRWSPGGYLDEATDCAGLFLGDALVATVKSRAQPDKVFRSAGDDKFTDFPMVALINSDTSGGAELVAAALQDHRRATVVGQRTRGKGSIQITAYLGIEGVGMKLTSGIFFRPNGKNLHRFPDSKPDDDWGVRPDDGHEFRLSPELSRVLAAAWQAQTLRPGTSHERLLLDDPKADAQVVAALEVLRERLAR